MRLRIVAAGVAVAVVGIGTLTWLMAGAARRGAAPAAPVVATTTARVALGDVTEWVQVAGVIDYDGAHTVVNQLPAGVLTAVPDPGGTVRRGARLFAVAGTPAVLLYGTTPAYREFTLGM